MASARTFFLENSAAGRIPVPDFGRLRREFVDRATCRAAYERDLESG
jgi:hypothetical protein